ncbi:sulfurtransferase [Uliginosibacterium paludis]|uniref:Sulfurtransferase n=1 Tax=Uliginosibacterium paludis TaxID=1615952 RepID=A0ABV2CVC8_9RHOO
MHSTIVSTALLARHLEDPRWLVIDVRHELSDPAFGRRAFAAGHIPGAQFLHIDDDLSAPTTGRNGRHPLPGREAFAARMGELGLTPQTQVVVYDAQGGMTAVRLWWMLRWIGHAGVAVLDGGLPAWLAAGLPVEAGAAKPRAASPVLIQPSLVGAVSAADLLANLAGGPLQVVDARSPDRFRGENETLDPVGGHIPGALNRFFRDNLGPDGHFKPADQLRAEFETLLDDTPVESVVAQCGSGITACHNLLALEIAGLPGARLYPGSWSEWCADPAHPVATGA